MLFKIDINVESTPSNDTIFQYLLNSFSLLKERSQFTYDVSSRGGGGLEMLMVADKGGGGEGV